MADTWRDEDVMRELDEANACYFVLMAKSAASLRQLVCLDFSHIEASISIAESSSVRSLPTSSHGGDSSKRRLLGSM